MAKNEFRFRVSDAVVVPLRGYLLRLRLLEGEPDLDEVKPGRALRLSAPDGEERLVRIKAFSVTGGKVTRERIVEKRELDVIISTEDAERGGRPVEIGWLALGPAK